MFKKVIVGVDGRTNGEDAVALAARLAGRDGRITLVHVHPGELSPSHAATPSFLREERAASMKLLKDARAAGRISAELSSVVALSAGRGLHQHAEEQDADLIVVGSCSRGRLGRVLIGDDTRAALNGAPCAIAIASRGYAEHPMPLATVGVAYNESVESQAALAVARELAGAFRARIEALEVLTLSSYAATGLMPPAVGEDLDSMLEQATARLQALPGVSAARAVYGLVGEELADFSGNVDILVTGSRGYGPVRRLMLGSTTEYLERHAQCSLLVLPRCAIDDRPETPEADLAHEPHEGDSHAATLA